MQRIVSIKENRLTNLNIIGVGGFATVYSAVWTRNGGQQERVAVKVFKHHLDDERDLRKHQAEVNRMARLNHENVVILDGETTINGRNAIVMELAVATLGNIIHSQAQDYSHQQALRWMRNVVQGVIYLHLNGIVHRDLNPNNLLLFRRAADGFYIVKISGFGICREIQTEMTNDVGTPAYMAPEVMRGNKYDHRCDVYSFGIILWEVFSRQTPFAGMTNVQILYGVGMGHHPPLAAVANFHQDIRALIERCWERQDTRPEMDQVLASLQAIVL